MGYGVLEDILYKLAGKQRLEQRREAQPTAVVLNTQLVKNAAGVSEERPAMMPVRR